MLRCVGLETNLTNKKMDLEQRFKEETGLDAYIPNDLRGHIAIDTYVEWLEEQCTINGVVLNEADFVNSDSINDEPEPLWKSHDLELASSEVELPCHCGKLMEEPYAPCCSLTCWCEIFEGQGN